MFDLPNTKPRAKLGRIGGKAKQIIDASRATNTGTSPRKGGDQDDEVHRGRSEQVSASLSKGSKPYVLEEASPAMSLSPVRETSQERADRKRVELKRELNDRSKMTVKKKRKF